jgi:hypothetical protein
MMYGIFIGFAACLGAPILYALSGFLVSMISRLGGMVSIPAESSSRMPLKLNFGASISPEFLFIFCITAIVLTTVFGSLIIGLIGSGKERDGIKYIPVLMITALAVYFISSFMINMMFGGLIPTG